MGYLELRGDGRSDVGRGTGRELVVEEGEGSSPMGGDHVSAAPDVLRVEGRGGGRGGGREGGREGDGGGVRMEDED
jgi:hypothetical protein